MDKVLLDTDVILDFFFDRMPFAEPASQVLSFCENKQVEGYITPVICSNVYYMLCKISNHKTVINKVQMLLSFIGVLGMDATVVRNALNSDFNDFEDALQYYSAVNDNNIDIILTRNVKDYKRSNISVMTPEIYLQNKI